MRLFYVQAIRVSSGRSFLHCKNQRIRHNVRAGMKSGFFAYCFLGAIVAICGLTALADIPPEKVVIVANANLKESRALAVYYANKRGIPRSNICFVTLPTNEVISRKLYEQALRDPLAEFMRNARLVDWERRLTKDIKAHQNPWFVSTLQARAIVLMYGVPVRIADTLWIPIRRATDRRHEISDKDTAAVESELALLFSKPYSIGSFIPNPIFRTINEEDISRSRLLVVTRLDGPRPDVVRTIIDRSVEAERRGLHGRAYFDAMGSRDGSYHIGDHWIREAYARFEREGYECTLDDEPRLFGVGYPMDSVALYLGWYSPDVVGPMALDAFRFMPGALAAHIHSSSAARLRTETEYWVGPLLARGACASWGAVSEPYLMGMPHLDVLADRLCSGWTFGESMLAALPVLSWQVAVVGDPLYTPFKLSLDEQIECLEKAGDLDAQWAYIRKVNLLVRDGRWNAALAYAREKVARGPYWVLMEKLGDLYAMNDMWGDADSCFEKVLENTDSAAAAVRVGLKWFPHLVESGQRSKAERWAQFIRKKWPYSATLGALTEAKLP